MFQCLDLVKVGGLNVLSSCYRLLGDQPHVCHLLSKIILSVSLHREHINDLHRMGKLNLISFFQTKM